MLALAAKYADVFATAAQEADRNNAAIVHSFLMKEGAQPVRDGERRRSPEEVRLTREMVAAGMASGIIEDSTGERSSQVAHDS